MNRFGFFCLIIATIGLLASVEPAVSAAEQPNFIFFITDDISWNDLGCYGNTFVRTPNLDRLAQSGIRFTNNYIGAYACSPSRGAFSVPISSGSPVDHDLAELERPLEPLEGTPSLAWGMH